MIKLEDGAGRKRLMFDICKCRCGRGPTALRPARGRSESAASSHGRVARNQSTNPSLCNVAAVGDRPRSVGPRTLRVRSTIARTSRSGLARQSAAPAALLRSGTDRGPLRRADAPRPQHHRTGESLGTHPATPARQRCCGRGPTARRWSDFRRAEILLRIAIAWRQSS